MAISQDGNFREYTSPNIPSPLALDKLDSEIAGLTLSQDYNGLNYDGTTLALETNGTPSGADQTAMDAAVVAHGGVDDELLVPRQSAAPVTANAIVTGGGGFAIQGTVMLSPDVLMVSGNIATARVRMDLYYTATTGGGAPTVYIYELAPSGAGNVTATPFSCSNGALLFGSIVSDTALADSTNAYAVRSVAPGGSSLTIHSVTFTLMEKTN
jgi:hypothetical protein